MNRRFPRPFAAFVTVLAVLFSQLAVSAYACPGADGMRAAVAVEDSLPCDKHPSPASPTPLCVAHCQQGDQSLDLRVPAPAVAFVALPSAWLTLRANFEEACVAAGEQPSLLERPTGPPLAVRNCCLRI